ncbi:MAG: hypothetical protein VXY56_09230 [Pseudomonadota bacterium]|nr:hypothetical protein [Pseudomonadota bacterium]
MKHPADFLAPALDQMIAAKRLYLQTWREYGMDDVTPAECYELFGTLLVDFGRISGQTFYIAQHAVGNNIALAESELAKKIIMQNNPHAQVMLIDEFLADQLPASIDILFVDRWHSFQHILAGRRRFWEVIGDRQVELIVGLQ